MREQGALVPDDSPIDANGADRFELPRADVEGCLEIWVSRSPASGTNEPDAFVLEFTGNGTRAEHIATFIARRWHPSKVEAWVVNYPGYGGSTGPARLDSIAPAALCAFDALAARAKGRPILVCGNSLGTTAALFVAAKRPAAKLMLQNPPPLRQIILARHGWWNLWLAAVPIALGVPDDLDSIANAARCRAPAVFVTGTRDTLVPPRFQQQVISAYAGPTRHVEIDADHNGSPDGSPEFRAALKWLISQASPVSAAVSHSR